MLVLRQTLLFFAIIGLIQSPGFSVSRAEAAPSKLSQEIDDIFELLPPARKGEKVMEFYDRLSPRLTLAYRMQLLDYLRDKYNQDMPKITVNGREATFDLGKTKAVLAVVQKGDDFTVKINGQTITAADAASVKTLAAKIEKIVGADMKKKNARLWRLMVPEAQADFDWTSGGIGALVGAALTYFGMTSFLGYKKPDPAPTYTCSGYGQCCAINGNKVVGCCNQMQATSGGILVYHVSDDATNCSGPLVPTAQSVAPVGTGTPIYKGTASPGVK